MAGNTHANASRYASRCRHGRRQDTTRAAFTDWLRTQHGLQALPDPDLEERVYYLAGEAPRPRSAQTWLRWYGLRYAVGPASGTWLYYWPGCNPYSENMDCYLVNSPRRGSLATAMYPAWTVPPLWASPSSGVADNPTWPLSGWERVPRRSYCPPSAVLAQRDRDGKEIAAMATPYLTAPLSTDSPTTGLLLEHQVNIAYDAT